MKIKLLDTAFRLFGYSPYESVNPSPHRSRVPGSAPTDTKKELTPHTRNEMVRRSRYLHKNSGFSACQRALQKLSPSTYGTPAPRTAQAVFTGHLHK